MVRVAWILGLCLVLGAAVAAPAGDDTEITLSVSGKIHIDPDGSVVDYSLDTAVSDELRKMIDSRVRGWRFEPIIVGGVAVPATTSMSFTIRAEPIPDNRFELHFGRTSFGSPDPIAASQRGRGAIQYPKTLLSARAGGRVLLAVRIDNDGQVIESHPYQTSLDVKTGERQSQKLREALERAALKAVAHWRYRMAESVDGESVAMSAIIPIDFAITTPAASRSKQIGWRALVPGPINRAPWQQPLPDDLDLASLEDGSAASLDSRFRLRAGDEDS